MSRISKVTLTTMTIVYDGKGNVLVQDRKNPDWPGLTFPGGHVERDEKIEDSAVREVYEETGLKISQAKIFNIMEWLYDYGERYIAVLFKSKTFEGEIRPSKEGDIYWIGLDEIRSKPLSNDLDKIIDMFEESL